MKKKNLFLTLAILCVVAAAAMYKIGSDSGHLSELKDFFWVPLPLGIISFILYTKNQNA